MQASLAGLFLLPWVATLAGAAPAVLGCVSENRWGRAAGAFVAGIAGAVAAWLALFLLVYLFLFFDATLHLRMARRVNPGTLLIWYAVAQGLGAWWASRLATREREGF